MNKNIRVLVLAGGVSEERAVSLATAKAVTESLKRLGYETRAIDSANGSNLLDNNGYFILKADNDSLSKLALKREDSLALTRTVGIELEGRIDVVFIALHGGMGENGTLQAILEHIGVRYTGSGRLASALAMNKSFAKKLVRLDGGLTPDWKLFVIRNLEQVNHISDEIESGFGFPLIIKPNDSGSTVGLTLVKTSGQLLPALENCFQVSREILAEKYIKGREITASILNGESLPLVEIIPTGEIYDYRCKYTKGCSKYVCPAEIPENIAARIKGQALKAYDMLGCTGLARVDFILDSRGEAYFLEVNTLPGMTELSLAPMAAREAGINFDELVKRICLDALSR